MTRHARLQLPGTVQHVIARFVNREFLLAGEEERSEYLRRLGRQLGRCDWRLLGYALMSSHVHLVLRAGADPSARLIAPLHTGFALWLNQLHGRIGPVFAGRHSTIGFEDERVAALLAYVHNNPVRAGIVARPADSTWTSHRAYLGIDPAPAWLRIEDGMALAGLDTAPGGGRAFDALVLGRSGAAREPTWSDPPRREKRMVRRAVGAPVRVSWPVVGHAGRAFVVQRGGELRPRWPGNVGRVVELVARHAGLQATELTSRRRDEEVAMARRLALVVWSEGLGRTQAEMAARLRISESAASQLLNLALEVRDSLRREAALLAVICWEEVQTSESNPPPPDSPPDSPMVPGNNLRT